MHPWAGEHQVSRPSVPALQLLDHPQGEQPVLVAEVGAEAQHHLDVRRAVVGRPRAEPRAAGAPRSACGRPRCGRRWPARARADPRPVRRRGRARRRTRPGRPRPAPCGSVRGSPPSRSNEREVGGVVVGDHVLLGEHHPLAQLRRDDQVGVAGDLKRPMEDVARGRSARTREPGGVSICRSLGDQRQRACPRRRSGWPGRSPSLRDLAGARQRGHHLEHVQLGPGHRPGQDRARRRPPSARSAPGGRRSAIAPAGRTASCSTARTASW